ncbi:hypothetical protein JCM15908A_08400 [Prevotella dentasini JCM 15908]
MLLGGLSSCSDNEIISPSIPPHPRLNKSDSLIITKVHDVLGSYGDGWNNADTSTWKLHVGWDLDKETNEYRVKELVYSGSGSGKLPQDIAKLTKLRILWITDNNISGTIPKDIGNLTDLELLGIYQCPMYGEIPKSIGKLKKLHTLWISKTNISSSIPKEIGKMNTLEKLDLSDNQLTGEIPTELKNVQHINSIELSRNHLSGRFPIEILHPNMIFYCENNDITELPFDIWKDELPACPPVLHGNRLTGIVPEWVKETKKWKKLSYYVDNQQQDYGYK